MIDNARIERERIRRKYRGVMLRLQGERDERQRARLERRRAKLNKRFLDLMPGQHVELLDPGERCARRILQAELNVLTFTDDEEGDQ